MKNNIENYNKKGNMKKWIIGFFGFMFFMGIGSAIFGDDLETEQEEVSGVEIEKEEAEQAKKEEEQKQKEEAKKAEEEKKQKEEFELTDFDKEQIEWWINDKYDLGVVDIIPIEEDYSAIQVVMINEMKLLNDNEKQYIVDDLGVKANNYFSGNFMHDGVWVEFVYQDGNYMAVQKVFGGWKLK